METATKEPSKLKLLRTFIVEIWESDSLTGSIFRNMAMLASGSAATKAIGILTMPVITRIYLQEHFGLLSVFTAITVLLFPFGTLCYSMAIPLHQHTGWQPAWSCFALSVF